MESDVYAPIPKEFKITPEGFPFIFAAFLLAVAALSFGFVLSAIVMTAITVLVCLFFRNPKRESPKEAGAIIAPADGKIVSIEHMDNDPIIGGATTKISTFMSIFNCHVNRAPVCGRVEKIIYNPGKFGIARFDKASQNNERNTVIIRDNSGRRFAVIQIAGIIARRIVCYLKEGMEIDRGARLGMIRFGSRVEIIVQRDAFNMKIQKGEIVRAGESIIGNCS